MEIYKESRFVDFKNKERKIYNPATNTTDKIFTSLMHKELLQKNAVAK